MSLKDISIIGGGLSGTLLTINLLIQPCDDAVRINLIDRNKPSDLGPAYSTQEDYLLNVPAGMMGAFSQDPEHFVTWMRERKNEAEPGDYLPRKLYREYIQSVLQDAIRRKKEDRILNCIRGEAVDIDPQGNKIRVGVRGKQDITTKKVVLALGNTPPKTPETRDHGFLTDSRYIRNPWQRSVLDRISTEDSVFFIGTGQTMVDLATELFRRGHTAGMTALSRRGLLPLAQEKTGVYPPFFETISGQTHVLPVFRGIRKQLRTSRDPRAVIDSLRPYTTAIWMNLTPSEKRRFLRHLFRYWEVLRSRIPPESDALIRQMRRTGQLQILSGKITDIIPKHRRLEIRYVDRTTDAERSATAAMIINCTGPNLDYGKIDLPLIRNLIRKKVIHPDPAHLGIDALPDGTVIGADG